MPTISVIVPVYKVEKYIKRCIDSIIAQTYQDWELILINDCTPDNSMQIIKKYAALDARIKYFEHDRNCGPMRARENGILAAKGNFVTFCDGDDTLAPNALELLYRAIFQTNADIISAEILYIPLKDKPHLFMGGQSLKYGGDSESVYKSMLLAEYGHNLCGKLFKRTLFSYEHDCFDDCPNGEDGYLFYQVVEHAKKICHLDEPAYNYYQNVESSSQKRLTKKGIRSILLLLQLRKKLMIKYPEIADLFSKYITDVLIAKYQGGYGNELDLNTIISEFGLSEFVSNRYMFKEYGLIEFIKLWAKKNVISIVKHR